MSTKKPDSEKRLNTLTTRRAFIQKTLKLTAGAYAGMAVIESFIGPKMGRDGMPLNAATMAIDVPPGDDPPSDGGRRDRMRERLAGHPDRIREMKKRRHNRKK